MEDLSHGLQRTIPKDGQERHSKLKIILRLHQMINEGSLALLIKSDGYNVEKDIFITDIVKGDKLVRIGENETSFAMSLLFDSKGFLWIGSDGLLRFDGYNFKRFKNIESDSSSLSSNIVMKIVEDRSGNLWIGTTDGLNLFDQKSETFQRFKNDPKDSTTIGSGIVSMIYEDGKGYIWTSGWNSQGLSRLDPKSKSFIRYKAGGDPYGLQSKWVFSMVEDNDGQLWLTQHGSGIARLDKRTNRFYTHSIIEDGKGWASRYVWKMIAGKTGTLILGTEYGIYEFDPRIKKHLTRYLLPNLNLPDPGPNQLFRVMQNKAGELWVGGGSIFGKLSMSANKLTQFRLGESTTNANVTDITSDREGNTWCGTEINGIWVLKPALNQFQDFSLTPKLSNDFTTRPITGPVFVDDEEIIWISHKNGLNLIHPTESSRHYYYDPESQTA